MPLVHTETITGQASRFIGALHDLAARELGADEADLAAGGLDQADQVGLAVVGIMKSAI